MGMEALIQMALNKLMSNPQVQERIKNDPTAQEYLNVIKSGDSKRGMEIANDILKQNGMNQQQGIDYAANYLTQGLQR